jgi:hypothetical protein
VQVFGKKAVKQFYRLRKKKKTFFLFIFPPRLTVFFFRSVVCPGGIFSFISFKHEALAIAVYLFLTVV